MSANDNFRLGYGDYKYGSILSYENEVLQSVFMNKASDLEDTSVNDRYVDGMHAVDKSDSKPSEYASCESDSSVETTTSMLELVENAPKVVCEPKVWTDAPIIEEYESDINNDSVSNVQEDKEKPTFAFTDSVKHVKTSKENVKETGTPNHSPKIEKHDRNGHTRKGLGYAFTRKACFIFGSFSHLHLIRDYDFHEKRMAKQAELTKSKNKDDPNKALKDKEIVDSGCSRHMTGNKAHLVDYQEFKGGSVAFRGSNGRIAGKGKKKAGRKESNTTSLVRPRQFGWVYFLKSKDETTPILKDFIRQVENQFNHKVKTIRSDNETKFKNNELIEFCGLKGIQREYSNAITPQQNRVAKRKNRTLTEAGRTMLADLFLPTIFWAEAVNTACYVLNIVLVTKPQNKTPYELLTGKFDGNSDSGVLVRYSLNSKAFKNVNTSSTNLLNTVSTPLSTAGPSRAFNDGELSYPDDHSMPYLEDIYASPNYDEVFAPMARIEAIRIFLAFASYTGFTVYQMDVKSDFMYGTIDEDVYVSQPPGFVDPKFPIKVKQKEDGIFISQDKYVAKILKKIDFLSVKTASTPIETQKPLVKDEDAADVDVHLYSKELASPKQTALEQTVTSKEKSNPFMAGSLPKTTLPTRSSVSYALTASLTIRTSCIKQFWTTAKVKTINDEVQIQALIDEKRVNIKESSIRHTLKLDDAKGTSCLANVDIFDGLAKMGYEKLSEKLTFYKAFFLPQWKFLIHTILQCLSAKTTSWNEFGSTMASTIICLATNQKFNFSRYILLSLVKNIEAGVPFFMFPRVVTALFDNMLVPDAEEVDLIQANIRSTTIPTEPSTSKPHKKHKSKKQQPQAPKVHSPEPSPEHRLPSPSNDILFGGQDKRIKKLEDRVAKLEEENMILKELHSVYSKADTDAPVVDKEKSFKQERIIVEIDEDVKINLSSYYCWRSTTAKAPKVSVPMRRRGVIIQDPEETTSTIVMHSKVQSKEKVKGILIEEPKPLKGKAQIEQDEAFARHMESELNANINWNVIMEQVKRSERLNDAAKDLKSHLQIVANDDDDIYTEATPPKLKIPMVDYRIHFERNKPYFKIIKADGNHMLFLSFSTMLKNFDREDLESLWKLVKERFEKTEPKNYFDDYLLKTLRIMFEQPDVEASI
uniref:Integrase catalytic domain-containing protein n=1 Tax=Tanacetum cinerariifolium TaxID=118510 RepID=A0A6L2MNY1_TANCI|nr:hypothetical protein [Tanacetum cinerariifolium]